MVERQRPSTTRLTPLQWRRKRKWLQKYPRPPDPPPGMMFNPFNDKAVRPFANIKVVEEAARDVYDIFDRQPKTKRRVQWGTYWDV